MTGPSSAATRPPPAVPPLHVVDWPVPPGRARTGSVLLVHGFGEHLGRYDDVASALNDLGLHVRGYDARGHGRSPGPRGVIREPPALLDDLASMFALLSSDATTAGDAAPPFVLGHSLGATLAVGAATSGRIAPRGLILAAPAFAMDLGPYRTLGLAVGRRLFPDRAMPNGQPQRDISHDDDAVDRVLGDPLVHDRITMRLARFAVDSGELAIQQAGQLRTPTLLLVAGGDRHVDVAGSRTFFDAVPAGTGTLRWYDGLYHDLFHEREPDRSQVLADVCGWLQARLGRTGAPPVAR